MQIDDRPGFKIMLQNKTIPRLATNQPHKIWVVIKKILDHK
jgi:hypothetical protein